MQRVVSCYYRHPLLGPVRVRVVASSKALRARWIGRELQVTIPKYTSPEFFNDFLKDATPKLLAARPEPRFPLGLIIDCGKCDFEICEGHAAQPRDVLPNVKANEHLRGKVYNYRVFLRPGLAEQYTPELETAINKALIELAILATEQFVVPRAKELAAQLGLSPKGWDVQHHRTRYGCCAADGYITLGARLIFMPDELRDYIICHELAHLSEMNHSPRFHAICNNYCGGREAELVAKLRALKLPVF